MKYNYSNGPDGESVCTLTISADHEAVVQIAHRRVLEIIADPEEFKRQLQRTKIHMYIDDSNVYFGGCSMCDQNEMVDMRALLRTIEKGRWTEKQVAVGMVWTRKFPGYCTVVAISE